MTKPAAKDLSNPVHFLALGFGSGLAPKAPGTFGTVAAIPVYWLLAQLPLSIYVLTTVVVCIAGVYICHKSAQLLQVHDHPAIVWDEIAGFLITMIAVPVDFLWCLAGFLLFRFFDIVKPWPISYLDRKVQGGLGIMLDDVLAGLIALGILHLVRVTVLA